jgi:thiol-disulfide isomerase/thioredoxin/YHS domain-containing protein
MLATRGLLFLAVLASAGIARSAPVGLNWQKDLDTARKLATQSDRLILVHFWSQKCAPCLQMERDTFSQSNVAKTLEATFVPVKIDADQYPKIANQFGIRRVPTDLVMTPDGKVVDSSTGFYPPAQYLSRMSQIAAAARRGPGTAPDRSLVAANVQPPYGSAPVDGRPAGAAPAGRQVGPSGWNVPPDRAPPIAAATTSATAPGGYAMPPGADPRDRNADPRGRAAEDTTSSPSGRTIPPSDRLARWPSSAGGEGSRRLDAAGPAPRNPGADPEAGRGFARPAGSAAEERFQPPLDLEGYCPVTLVEQGRWVRGDRRYGVIHHGRTYLFTGQQEADRFFQNPDRYAPVLSGNDVVVFVDQGQTVPGRRAHGAVFGDRVYLFSSEASYEKFAQNTHRYLSSLSSPEKKTSRRPDAFRDPPADRRDAQDPTAPGGSRDLRNDRRWREERGGADGGEERRPREERGMQDERSMRDERGEPLPSRGGRY